MATFRVGQRVRVHGIYESAPSDVPDPTGLEATIVSAGDQGYDWTILASNGHLYDYDSWELEPLQSDRNRVVAWEDLNLPFDPRKVGEVA